MNRPGDPFIDLAEIASAIGVVKAQRIAFELAGYVENTSNWLDNYSEQFSSVADLITDDNDALKTLYLEAYAVFDSPHYVSWFKDAGYDGAIHAGSGESAGEAEYKVFSEKQVLFMSMRENPRGKFQSIASQIDPMVR